MPGEKTVGKNFGGDSNLGLYGRAPLASDYMYPIGFLWIDTSSDPRTAYTCVKNDAGDAEWLSGGSSHDKGFFADEIALVAAVPSGEAGDWAVVGDTDSIWIWDVDTTAWVNSQYSPAHAKGWFADEAALVAAVPSGVAGDWAIVGATDTVWIWVTDTGAWIDSGEGSIVNWGDIGGLISNQTDLQNALDAKLDVTSSTVLSVDTVINGVNGSAYVSDSTSPLTHTLVSIAGKDGYTYTITNINTGAVKIQGDGVEKINGYSSITIYKGESITVRAYSGGWIII
jgi:hypothetical protein